MGFPVNILLLEATNCIRFEKREVTTLIQVKRIDKLLRRNESRYWFGGWETQYSSDGTMHRLSSVSRRLWDTDFGMFL